MHKYITSLLLLSLSFFACERDKNTPKIAEKWDNDAKVLVVKLDKIKLRKNPHIKGETIDTLHIGAHLLDKNEVGENLTLGSIDSVMYWSPWLKVETKEGQEGWVYAEGIDFSTKESVLSQKKAMALFGKQLYVECLIYQEKQEEILTAKDFAVNYRKGIQLRDSIIALVDIFLEKLPMDVGLPNFFWLEEILPGFITQLVAEGSRYYLFADYKHWYTISKASKGEEDDDYVQICFDVFPTDSIEYFFSAWTIQTWDYGGHSLLGRGIHLGILKSIDSCLTKSQLFQPGLQEIKQEILDDITVDDITYWESKEKIGKEVSSILTDEITILTKEDKIALEVRLMQFKSPEKYNIDLNLFPGRE